MKLGCLLLVAAAAFGQLPKQLPAAKVPAKAGPSRAAITAAGKAFDGKVLKVSATDPLELMSSAQGVYIEGFGVVFTAEIDLIMTPTINPFRQKMSKQEVAGVRTRKLERLPVLKTIMRESLVETAATLDALPPDEQVVFAVSLFYFNWEDISGLPAQIVMRASKSDLLVRASADSAIQVREH